MRIVVLVTKDFFGLSPGEKRKPRRAPVFFRQLTFVPRQFRADCDKKRQSWRGAVADCALKGGSCPSRESSYLRHDDGKYCGEIVLTWQFHVMLPAAVAGDSTRVCDLMATFVVDLLYATVI